MKETSVAANPADDKDSPMPGGNTVLVEIKDQIAWVTPSPDR